MSFLSHLSLKSANRSFAKNSTVFSYTLNLFLSCMKDFLVYMEGQCLSILHTSIDMLLFFVLFFFVFRQKKAQAWRKPALTGESIWKRRGPVQLLTHRSNMWVTSFSPSDLSAGVGRVSSGRCQTYWKKGNEKKREIWPRFLRNAEEMWK